MEVATDLLLISSTTSVGMTQRRCGGRGWSAVVVVLLLALYSGHTWAACPSTSCPNCPCFPQSQYRGSISESAPIGSTILTVTATSVNTFTYSIPTRNQPFNIDQHVGLITLSSQLNFEAVASYTLLVLADDGINSATTQVEISVLNENDNSPQCIPNVAYFSICEEKLQSSPFLLSCTDADEPTNPVLNFDIIAGNETGVFHLDSQGEITLVGTLDYENQSLYELVIIVSDVGTPPFQFNSTTTVIISVQPINEYQPTFQSNMFNLSIIESAGIGATVGSVNASDLDLGEDGVINYSIESSVQSNPFTVEPGTGDVILTRTLDFETLSSHQFRVLASDSSPNETSRLTATATVVVQVLDANDNSPVFERSLYVVQVPEDSAVNYEVLLIHCTDADFGQNQLVTYTISSGNNNGKFALDTATGQITLASTLDYDMDAQMYELQVQCRERTHPYQTDQAVVMVEVTGVNEYYPNVRIEFTRSIHEDTVVGTSIVEVTAQDNDAGIAGEVQYRLNHDNTCPQGQFYIDSSTGVVYLTRELDYDAGMRQFHCIVTVRDMQPPIRFRETDLFFTITNVNDVPPVCDPPFYVVNTPEDSHVGSEIISFSCTNPESSGLEYSIPSNLSVPFLLISTSTQARLTLQDELDADDGTQTTYIIPIHVSSSAFPTEITVTVYVSVSGTNEYAPVFVASSFECSNITENSSVGTSVCEVLAFDNDSGIDGIVNYQITSGNANRIFGINSKSGQIVLTGPVDHEQNREYNLVIEAYDSGTPPQSSSVQVNITVVDENDNVPQIAPLLFTDIPESAPLNAHIMTVPCSDLDTGRNAEVEFEITSISSLHGTGIETTITNDLFTINPTIGDLSLSGGIDFEAAQLYKVNLVCRDHGTPSLSANSTVILQILPQNEFQPTFGRTEYTVSVAETAAVGMSLLQVTATDEDFGKDGDIQFSLSGTSVPFLGINPQSGILSVAGPIDCTTGTQYTISIQAEDGGDVPYSTYAQLSVSVTGCKLGVLVPETSIYIANISESAAIKTDVLSVSCRGTRESLFGPTTPQYTIHSNVFQINSTSGEVSVSHTLDYETAIYHLIPLQCFDPNDPSSIHDFSAYVSIIPENEHTPVFRQPSYTIDIPESTVLGSVVLTVEASDFDHGTDGKIHYFIQGVEESFTIDPISGVIYLTDLLDRETNDQLSFVVGAQDCPQDPSTTRHAYVRVAVNVLDSNDHRPRCNRTVYSVTVSPYTDTGTSLVNLSCSDEDLGSNAQLQYTFTDSNATQFFSIKTESGQLTLAQSLDPDISVVHNIPITVQDLGNPPLSSTVVVIVDVRDSVVAVNETSSIPDFVSLVEAEGLMNSVTMVLQDLTKGLWDERAEDNFHAAVARSVTHYCALLPEACSLISGCVEFYSTGPNQKRSTHNNYASFVQLHVVLLEDYPKEIQTGEVTALELRFYVILPDDATKAPQRETDYVIPRGTLNQILQDDSEVIEAIVRDSVAPSITIVESSLNSWKVIAISFVVITAVLISVIAVVAIAVAIYKYKQRTVQKTKVVPIRINGQKSNKNSTASKNSKKGASRKQPGSGSKRTSESSPLPLGAQTPSDSCSIISLDDEIASSMENNARGSLSQKDILTDLESVRSHQEGEGLPAYDRESSSDYLQNWPWRLPGSFGAKIRPGHARIGPWFTGRTS